MLAADAGDSGLRLRDPLRLLSALRNLTILPIYVDPLAGDYMPTRIVPLAAPFRTQGLGRLWLLASCLLCVMACSGDPEKPANDASPDSAARGFDSGETNADTGAAVEDAGGRAVEDVGAACPGGTGCPCKENDDCDASLCLEGKDGSRCAAACTDQCSPGFQCKFVPTGADVAAVCISSWARLCNPCRENKDCRYLGIDDARCVDRGEAGGFCGTACTVDGDDCPSGHACKSIKDLDGNTTKQCVPVAPSGKLAACVCSDNAVVKAVKAVCRKSLVVDDVEFSCDGEAQCKTVGESAECIAKEPSKEICDGLDNNCDGATDESSCDDKQPCTIDKCDPEKGCVHTPLTEGSSCEADDSVCTQGDKCKGGACVAGTLITCDDKNPCTISKCDPKSGCVQNNFDGGPCEDGNPCTIGDTCKDAGCVAGKPKLCKAIQACKQGVCDAGKGGLCVFSSKPDGTSCVDGSACSTSDMCKGGTCKGTPLICDDKNPCTSDSCLPVKGCSYAANTASCEDGDACTSADVCKDKVCSSGVTKDCDDGEVCTTDACDKKTGCSHTANTLACDDGDVCTLADVCKNKVCSAGKAKVCDDGNPCTAGVCKSGTCAHAPLPDKTLCANKGVAGAAWCMKGKCENKSVAKSCAAVLSSNPKAKSGLYLIDPDAGGSVNPVEVYCDMQLGGWTLVGNYYDTTGDDMPNSTALVASGWQQTASGKWTSGAKQVDRKGAAAGNAAVGLDYVAALVKSAGQQHIKICLVHKDGTDSVCRSSFAGSLTPIAYISGNPKLTPYKSDALTYTFGRLAGLAGSADGYSSFKSGKFEIKRAVGKAGEFGFSPVGLVEKAEDPNCLGDGGPWHGAGCGVSYRPHRKAFDELSTASCCLVGGGHAALTSYGFRIYIGPAPTLGTLNNPAKSCQAIVDSNASLGDGKYWLDVTGQGTTAAQLSCLMSSDGGGWTQLTDDVAKALKGGVQRSYLFTKNGAWYRSPKTTQVWSWTTGQELIGTWNWFNGKAASAFQCLGSAEKPAFGIGCSAGATKVAKVLPKTTKAPLDATLTVCQTFPNAFAGAACEKDVQVWVR